MTNPKRPGIDIDDAENIRRFSAQIRRTAGRQASVANAEQPNLIDAPVPSTMDFTPVNEPSVTGHSHDANGNAPGPNMESLNHGLGTPDLPAHPIWNEGDRLAHLPRAVQQTMQEIPYVSGVRAPHPTPETFKPAPLSDIQNSPELSEADKGRMLVNEVVASLPCSGGIEDSIWAKPRVRGSRMPNVTDGDQKLTGYWGLLGTQQTDKEARERGKEHNKNYERMSFKIADAPSERTFVTSADKENNSRYASEVHKDTPQLVCSFH